MPKSAYVAALEIVQQPVTSLLRAQGFKKLGRTYNRVIDDGLIHVVNFQMGQYSQSVYGSFTVNLGVYLPCVAQVEQGTLAKRIYHEYDCQIRTRLGNLTNSKRDVWWSLNDSAQAIGILLSDLIREFGFPFLDKYPNYEAVLTQHTEQGKFPDKNKGRSALTAAIVCYHLNKLDQARELFDRAAYREDGMLNTPFGDHVANIRKQCNL